MPSFFRHRSPSPTAIPVHTGVPSKSVGFAAGASPVTSLSRPLTNPEKWNLYYFEAHTRMCPTCIDPYRVHKTNRRLCESGHVLAQGVARIIYSEHAGRDIYDAAFMQGDRRVMVELPHNYLEVRSLLRAMERSLRHRHQRPIVSFDPSGSAPATANALSRRLSPLDTADPTYRAISSRHNSARRSSTPSGSSPDQSRAKRERRKSQIVEWPEDESVDDARPPPTAWKDSRACAVRPVTPENRSSSSRDLDLSPARSSASRSSTGKSASSTPPQRSRRASFSIGFSVASTPTHTPSPLSSTAEQPKLNGRTAKTSRIVRRDSTGSTAPAPLPASALTYDEVASRRRYTALSSEDNRRASMYDGASFTTEIREPKSRRWSAVYS